MTSDGDTLDKLAIKIENDASDIDVGSTSSSSATSRKGQIILRLLIFAAIGITSLLLSLTLAHHVLKINLPRTVEDIQTIAKQLEEMTDATWTDSFTVAGVFSILYLWQQAFSIPGSILFNLLYGYLYGILFASLWTSLLTAAGATLAYGLSMLIAEPFLQLNWVSRRVTMLTSKMRKDKTRSVGLFWWLLFVRLFPFTPYWVINMVSPFLGIPVFPFFWSTFFGSMPYNFISAQAGQVLGELTSTADIFSISLILKLLLVSFVSLVPVIWGDKLKTWIRQFIVTDGDDYERLEKDADDRLELEDINISMRS